MGTLSVILMPYNCAWCAQEQLTLIETPVFVFELSGYFESYLPDLPVCQWAQTRKHTLNCGC